MRVFISWSGSRSQMVASAFRDWLPSVLQSVEPFMSAHDVEKGSRWALEIAKQLEAASFGLICVTKENLVSPWLNFEVGALSKAIDSARVTPILIDIRPSDLTHPLAAFQAAALERTDLLEVVRSLNALTPAPLPDQRLADTFEMWWPKLNERLRAALEQKLPAHTSFRRDTAEIVEEVLDTTRALQREIMGLRDDFNRVDPRASEASQADRLDALAVRLQGLGLRGASASEGTDHVDIVMSRSLSVQERRRVAQIARSVGFKSVAVRSSAGLSIRTMDDEEPSS